MKKIFIGILKGIKRSLERFPLTISISSACVIMLIYISEIRPEASNNLIETLTKVVMVLALGVPISLCIKLLFERKEQYKKVSQFVSYIGGAVLLIAYYNIFLKEIDPVSTSRYIAFSLILYLIFLFISYFPDRKDFEFYVIRIFTRFFTTILYSLVLYLGLSAILLQLMNF